MRLSLSEHRIFCRKCGKVLSGTGRQHCKKNMRAQTLTFSFPNERIGPARGVFRQSLSRGRSICSRIERSGSCGNPLRIECYALDFGLRALQQLIAMSAQCLSALVDFDGLLEVHVSSFEARYDLLKFF